MAAVLVVDDDGSMRETLERLLTKQGHRVRKWGSRYVKGTTCGSAPTPGSTCSVA